MLYYPLNNINSALPQYWGFAPPALRETLFCVATANKKGRLRLLSAISTPSINQSTPDEQLVTAAQQGSEPALVELINRHQSLLLAVARAIVGAAHAEDTVQEAWLSVYRSLAKFEGRSSFKTWVVRIVSNEAKTRLRRDAKLVSMDDSEFEQPEPDEHNFNARGHWTKPPARWNNESPDALIEEEQLQRCINKTLSILPERQKAAFLLRDLERQPLVDIAELLDISNANVRVLLHRARLTLMQVVARYQETGQC